MYLARVLPVPVGDEVVELSLDDLPGDIEDYVTVLREERCSAPFWMKLASECGVRGRMQDCETVLHSAIRTLSSIAPANNAYRSQQAIAEEVAPFHAVLSILQLERARSLPKLILQDARYQNLIATSPGIESRDRSLQNAAAHASAVVFPPQQKKPVGKQQQQQQPSPSLVTSMRLSRAVHQASIGETEEALRNFEAILQRQSRNPVALLGKACCLLRKKTYSASLKCYQEVLSISIAQAASAAKESAVVGPDGELVESNASKWLGPDPRVGIGLCLYGLGRISEAQRAWSRALVVNPSNAAPHLLLGLSKINMAKQASSVDLDQFGKGMADEESARAAIYKQGLAHVQTAWKLDNKNAMSAVALAEHFCVRATVVSATDKANAQQDYERALKLAEHAIQYADNRSAFNQARLTFARTAHLYSYLDETSATTVELRSLAQRYYLRVADDLARPSGSVTEPSGMAPGHAMAVLGLAQMQVARGEALGAMNTVDVVLSKSPSTPATLELAIFAAALRAQSHPGASPTERLADRQKAKVLLDRTMQFITTCSKMQAGEDALDESLKAANALVGQTDGSGMAATEAAEVAAAQAIVVKEDLGPIAVREIAAIGDDELNYVLLSDLFRDVNAGTVDFVRSSACLLNALRVLRKKGRDIQQDGLASVSDLHEAERLAVRLRANLGATLALRGLEMVNQDPSFITLAVSQLQESLNVAGKASTTANLDDEKTILLFNLGRVLEISGHADEATKAYDAVLANHPEFVDAKVRSVLLRVCRESARGDLEARHLGNALLKEALLSDQSNLDTRAAYVCFLAGDLAASPNPPQWDGVKDTIAYLFMGPTSNQAVQMFGSATTARAVSEEARKDAFTLSSLAWAYYNLAHSAGSGSSARKERIKGMLRCCDLLDKALAEDSKCAFALQGLAILAAEGTLLELSMSNGSTSTPQELETMRKRSAEDALNMLTKLREVKDDASVHICMGHAYMVRDDYERALRAYELAARDSAVHPVENGDTDSTTVTSTKPSLLQALARAAYYLGLQKKAYPMLKRSIAYMEQAIERLRERASSGAVSETKFIQYNIAVTRQKALQMLFDLPVESRQLDVLLEAVEGIALCQQTFKDLLPDAQAGKLHSISGEVVEQRMLYSESSLQRQATKSLDEQRAYEDRTKAERDAIAARQKERLEAVERERLESEQERLRALEAIEEERRRQIAETRDWNMTVIVEEAKARTEGAPKKRGGSRKTGSGKRKRKNKMDEGGSEIESEDDGIATPSEGDDDMIVDDDAAIEQGDFSEEEVLGRPDDSGDEEEDGVAPANGGIPSQQRRQQKLKRLSDKASRKSGGGGGKIRKEKRKSRTRQPSNSGKKANGGGGGGSGGEGDSSAAESDRPAAKKSKKGKMRLARDDDMIESEEEIV